MYQQLGSAVDRAVVESGQTDSWEYTEHTGSLPPGVRASVLRQTFRHYTGLTRATAGISIAVDAVPTITHIYQTKC